MRILVVLGVVLCLGVSLHPAWGAETTSLTDRQALAALQELAARRPPYSPEVASQVRQLVMQLWDKPGYRHRATTLLNLNQGYLDWLFSRSFVLPPEKQVLPNFARVDRQLYRGGQPNAEGFRRLKEMGVKTIINLRLEDPSEEQTVRELGLNYYRIPLPDTMPPTAAQVAEFLAILRNPANGKVYVHCAAGKNRTGAMVAVWRIENGMSNEAALQEALRYGLHPHLMAADRIADFIRRYRPQPRPR
ncbi:MAG: Protein tyrosine/serine phosphatase [Candidatus Ozemobacter sibiricus]|jgi:protein tyrosine/serine phosphatase|uniref:Protein tyrosine/serine phosphatase n=1 Tax=Candidatus Ozemobacter sibiricus TaxID=2268124 RepID=A0A367ZL57_9BACT|nr:MAG: Protein tyrosine/serine phosphatase [Candidatus Ozemobacter sibiricus]